MVYPGLATNKWATALLRRRLTSAGYAVYDWAHGVNRGPQGDVEQWFSTLAGEVRALAKEHKQPVSLVGWSLGGILAREIAKRAPSSVRQVITLGSPFGASPDDTNAKQVFELLNPGAPALPARFLESLKTPPSVPLTAIFSRTDGVVPWQGCVELAPGARNIVLDHVSHFGMVLHPDALQAIGRSLNQAPPAPVVA